MNFTDEQRQRVTAWILQGAKLSEVQSRLQSEFNLKLTYMETRFLVDDLKLTPKDPEPPKVAAPISELSNPAGEKGGRGATAAKGSGDEASPPPASRNLSVSVDQIARPGAIVSGRVTFG